MSAFIPAGSEVLMITEAGPVRLTNDQCERLLDIFDEAEAVRPFNELYAAHVAAGGLERVTSLRGAA